MKKSVKAVITADIVNSTLLSKGEFELLIKLLEQQFKKAGTDIGFYRGDSFHALCDPGDALKMACLTRTTAIQFTNVSRVIDTRISIGIGTVDEPIGDLGTARGEAFTLSGREMDRLEKSGPRLSIRCNNPIADTALAAIALFTDHILTKLTVKQAAVVHELLQCITQTQVAKKLQKRQSTISKHASASDWNKLSRLNEIYRDLVKHL